MNKKLKKLLATLMAVTIIGASFVGCGANNNSSNTANGNETSEEAIEIVYTHFQAETDAQYDAIQEAIKRFEDDNPNVTIKQEYYPHDSYILQIDTLGVSDEIPDIAMVNGTKAKEFASSGVILDLDDYIAEYGLDSKIYPDAFSELKYDSSIYAVPWEYANYAFILYNKGIFDEAGIDEFPETIDELIDASKKISDLGYIPMAMGDKALWPADSLAFSAFVNNFVGNDWYESILAMDGTAKFTDLEFVNALTEFQRLATEGVFNENLISIDNDQRGALYQNREAAMISAGNWECNSIVGISPEVAEETYSALWPIPAEGAKAENSIVSSSAWGLAVGANIDEEKIPYAMDFIANYICSQEYGQIFTEGQGMFVPWKIDYDASKINIVTQRQQEVALADGVTGCLNWDSTLPALVKDVYQRGLQEILINTKTPETLAQEMQEAYEEAMDE